MSRPHSFPDPDDRSPNDPSVIVTSEQVLGIYNRAHANEESKMQKVTTKVQEWFTEQAYEQGWNNVEFAGNQCILRAKITRA